MLDDGKIHWLGEHTMKQRSKISLVLLMAFTSFLYACEEECLCMVLSDVSAKVSEASTPITLDSSWGEEFNGISIDMGPIEVLEPQYVVLALEPTAPQAIRLGSPEVLEGIAGIQAEDIDVTWKESGSQAEYLLPTTIPAQDGDVFLVIRFMASEVGPVEFDLLFEYDGGMESSMTVRVAAQAE